MGLELEIGDEPELEGLWEAHLPAWSAWCEIEGQWRTVSVSTMERSRVIWIGLDYAAADAGLTMAGFEMTPDLWAEVRAIEAGAREELNRHGR